MISAAMLCSSAITALGAKPNILWLTCEDINPDIECYGDSYADTPNLNKLADEGMIYINAWSTLPVCAPARTTIISGVYANSLGAHHMRSMTQMPEFMKMYPQFLREAGYYCSNNRKEDYNLEKPGRVWNDSSGNAHWKNRKEGQPFFAIFNFTVTHESQIRNKHDLTHDPANVDVPPYHPDTPEVRHDWAQYYDRITQMDTRIGEKLQELEEAGLENETIVFFYGDHGSGMPRHKRFCFDSGLRVPMIVYIPEQFKDLAPKDYAAGAKSKRLVGFVDLAPTVLSLAGIRPPEWMQGNAFLGKHITPPQRYMYGLRGRMDERRDMVRTVRDERYQYIHNYMPHREYGQYVSYMFQTPTTKTWKSLFDQGKLTPTQAAFWKRKPPEELYDLTKDPFETNNLAYSPEHKHTLERFRKAEKEWITNIRDTGFLPEGEIHSRAEGSTPYVYAHSPEYRLEKIQRIASLATGLDPADVSTLKSSLSDADSSVRYWAAMGILMRGQSTILNSLPTLRNALKDSSPYVRIVVAEALAKYGTNADVEAALDCLAELSNINNSNLYAAIDALNAADKLDRKAETIKGQISEVPESNSSVHPRMKSYIWRLKNKIAADLE
ncbi:MAG: sulfatase-like hydrolase/transferase [Verrucomicrobia bacterium]|nr:sulfatase-like hydrolase/transferase [Verrucomicrobiota bacterium]